MRWEGHVARIVDKKILYRILLGRPEGKDYLEDLGVDGRISLNRILNQWDEDR